MRQKCSIKRSRVYDTATITSNTGSVSFDRSVYPVPWTANDLSDGAGNLSPMVNTEAGDVTAWITVTDIDETGDTMTVGGASAGKITVTIGTDHMLYSRWLSCL